MSIQRDAACRRLHPVVVYGAEFIFDFLENGGRLPEDPLAGTGAELAYIAIDTNVFPADRLVEVRGNIEEALDDALENEQSGRTLGGAGGVNESYIDLLLVDGDNSRSIVENTLENLQLNGRFRIRSFV